MITRAQSFKLPRSAAEMRILGLTLIYSLLNLYFHSLESFFPKPCVSIVRSDIDTSLSMATSPNTRRKMGPPLRKQFSDDPSQQQLVGRATVYCVGQGLDLQGLRAHVFRRSFSGANINAPNMSSASAQSPDISNLMLSRGITSEKDIEDEVLHVTNSPLLMKVQIANDRPRQLNPKSLSMGESIDNDDESNEDEADVIRRNMLLFSATQDIFYFDYGCVVFWGLSPQEERAALTELAPFTIEPTSTEELRDSYDTMEYIYDRKANPQRPIRFDRMKVRTLDVEEKMSLSYGMAQSSKLFVLESRVLQSIEKTRYLPKVRNENQMEYT